MPYLEKYIYTLTPLEVEWILSSLGIVKTDLEYDPFDEEDEREYNSNLRKKEKRDDESDEEERDDRQYSWKIYKNK
jgi:hypothetical protein